MCKLDGKTITPKRTFSYKEEWPGECTPRLFKELVKRIVTHYDVGDRLTSEDCDLLDSAILWESVCIESELAGMSQGNPIPFLVMECFENWNWRIENGEEPQGYNYGQEEAF